MREAHLLITICLVIFVANNQGMSVLAQEQRNSACLPNREQAGRFKQCIYSWECCSGCCNDGFCSTRNATCVDDKHPCESRNCPSCKLEPVNCLVSPCPPVVSCDSPVNPNPCGNVTCKTGEHCELPRLTQNTPPRCVKDSSCAGMTCPNGSTCVMSGRRPECVASCEKFECSSGSRCGLQLLNACTWESCDLTPKCLPVSG